MFQAGSALLSQASSSVEAQRAIPSSLVYPGKHSSHHDVVAFTRAFWGGNLGRLSMAVVRVLSWDCSRLQSHDSTLTTAIDNLPKLPPQNARVNATTS